MVGGMFLYGCDHHSCCCYGDHSHTKIAPLPSKITYIKMKPLDRIRKGFVHGIAMNIQMSRMAITPAGVSTFGPLDVHRYEEV